MKQKYNIILQIILGYIFADIITGTVHWFEDSYLDYCNTIKFLSSISKANELHHYFPRSMLVHTDFETFKPNFIEGLIVLVIVFIIMYKKNKTKYIFKYKYFIITFFIFSSSSNLIHKYSHKRNCENNKC